MSLRIHTIETRENDVSATGTLDDRPFTLKGNDAEIRFIAHGREMTTQTTGPMRRSDVTGALYGFVARLRADSKISSGAFA